MSNEFTDNLISELKRDPHLKAELSKLLSEEETNNTNDYVDQSDFYSLETKVEDLENTIDEITNGLAEAGDSFVRRFQK